MRPSGQRSAGKYAARSSHTEHQDDTLHAVSHLLSTCTHAPRRHCDEHQPSAAHSIWFELQPFKSLQKSAVLHLERLASKKLQMIIPRSDVAYRQHHSLDGCLCIPMSRPSIVRAEHDNNRLCWGNKSLHSIPHSLADRLVSGE